MISKQDFPSIALIGLFLSFVPGSVAAQQPLERNLQTIHLGMTPEAFHEGAPSVEMNDLYLNLVPGERFLKIREDVLADGITEFTGRFYQGRLYKITVEYRSNWFDDEGWKALVGERMKQYGDVPVNEMETRDGKFQTARWEDPATIHIVRRQIQLRFKDNRLVSQSTVFVTYLDKFLWEKRSALESEELF